VTVALRTLAVAVPLLVLVLSGCALLPDESETTTPIGSPTVVPGDIQTHDAELQPTMSAVIVVAGADVDGQNVSVSGYVAGILEDGGQCGYVFTGLSGVVTAESTGIPDRSVTSCGTTQVPMSQFAKGTWEVVLSYTPNDGDVVVSEPTKFEIP